MQDTARHGAPQPDIVEARHTLSVRDVETLFINADVPRSHRHVIRMCSSGMLDAIKAPGASGDEWFVAPASVPKAIGDLKQMDASRARHGTPQPAVSDRDAPKKSLVAEQDMAGHSAPQQAVSNTENKGDGGETEPATARHGMLEHDIYEHPYVKRLEAQVDKLEKKYDDQVRRTEEIQMSSQKQILELQRMTAIGQSQTLADFMLKAKEWVLGPGSDNEKREPVSPPTTA